MSMTGLLMPSGRVIRVSAADASQIHWPDLAEIAAKTCYFHGLAPGGIVSHAQLGCLIHDQLSRQHQIAALVFGASAVLIRCYDFMIGEDCERLLDLVCQRTGDPATMADDWPDEVVAMTRIIATAACHDTLASASPQADAWPRCDDPRPQAIPLIAPWPWKTAMAEWLARAKAAGLTWEG